jgi:stage II sporulation protein D
LRSVSATLLWLLAGACAASYPSRTSDSAPRQSLPHVARVVLAARVDAPPLAATGAWRLTDESGAVAVRAGRGEQWRLEGRGSRLRAVRADGTGSASRSGGLTLRTADASDFVVWNGKRYRGELRFVPTDSGVLVLNNVDVEDYLRGVVPIEIGTQSAGDRAAVEAQAIAARSYAVVRMRENASTAYDLLSSTLDQVYGGVSSETNAGDAAIRATAELVLLYDRRPVSAPYHSACGGSTADPTELWRTTSQPFLQRVSDRIPGTDRYYCDIAPRFRWERTWDASALESVLERYLRNYASVPAGPIGAVRSVSVEGHTLSGRVSAVTISTDRGAYRVRGNDMRFVLRSSGGEMLNSTYFSPEPVVGRDGRLTQLTLRGNGYGHGVGMCQWGAIGRARAGQDSRTILRTYFPGTTVGRVGT